MRKIGFPGIAFIVAIFCVATAVGSHAQTLATLLSFDSSTGSYANTPVQGLNGNFFGTAQQYGQNNGGTAYELTPGGTLSDILSFCSQPNCPAGASPRAAILLASDGTLYGTTNADGANAGGTIFKVSAGGQLTTLYNFCSLPNCADGAGPTVLVEGRDGNLYGIAEVGGTGQQCDYIVPGCGTVFQITKEGVLTTLHNFCTQAGCLDGALPTSLVLATDGTFYGTAPQGGSGDCFDGCGTLFRIRPDGKLIMAYSFTSTQGSYPNGVIEGTDGNFYGTTRVDGLAGQGTVFQFNSSGQMNVLYNFCEPSSCPGGAVPWAGLVQGTDGNFYGTTNAGGTGQYCPGLGGTPCGTIFKISAAGEFTSLYSFCSRSGCADGGVPLALLIQGTDGAFYGTTSEGANTSCRAGCGTVFKLDVGLGPFVQANPVLGKVGYKIGILGNDLTGTTSVTFNGTPTTFTVVSDTYLKATVPTGATTGTIEVTTTGGTLKSNLVFQVLP
jgi:uncharacterized repeat protein (TIGR03803 family)